MKTAIILVGNVRTWNYCKDNFNQIFSKLNPDIFLSTYDLQYNYHPAIKNKIGDYTDILLTEEFIKKMFEGFNVKDFDIEDGQKIIDMTQVNSSFKEYATCYGQYSRFQKSIQMIEKSNIEYDCVIKTRCDLIHNDFHFVDLKRNIIIDSGNIFPNDCVLITNQNSMKNISNFIMKEFLNPKYSDSHLNPPHGILHNAIKEESLLISSQKIMNCVIRKDGKKYYY